MFIMNAWIGIEDAIPNSPSHFQKSRFQRQNLISRSFPAAARPNGQQSSTAGPQHCSGAASTFSAFIICKDAAGGAVHECLRSEEYRQLFRLPPEALQDPVKMEAREGNSSDIRRPETEVGSANASNTSNFIEDFNDVPSNQGDFEHSAIDPSVRPSKKVRSKVWDHLIKICAENLKDQRAKCKYCGAILGADPAKDLSSILVEQVVIEIDE
ncbi:hypothetical protein Ancab_016412 [Ancistrocladus abbreviatus]